MNQRELDRTKARLKKFINTSSDAEFDALVAEANKVGFRELSRKLLGLLAIRASLMNEIKSIQDGILEALAKIEADEGQADEPANHN